MRRRTFFGTAFAGLAVPRAPKAKPGDIPMRVLGRTGEKLTIIGQGGARFHLVPLEEGKAVVRHAYELGINYFDMARAYSDGYGEQVYGAVIPEFRKKIFLTSKSGKRTRQGAEAELEATLRTMRTDYLDLWQIHLVKNKQEVEQVFAPGGAMEAFEAAKKAGKVRYIGFTSCRDPQVHVEMLRHAERFDTALPAARERGVGIFAIKVFGNAFLLRTFSVGDCLRYTLTLPITAAPLGCCTIGQLEDDVRIAQSFRPLTEEQMSQLRARAGTGKIDTIRGAALEYWKTRD